MKEVRFHGRGGQGAALAAEILAAALVRDGSYAAAFPMFGFERRGAPVTAFLRFDAAPVRERTQVYAPDCLVVLEPGLARTGNIFAGLKAPGVLIINAAALPALPPGVDLGLAGGVRATAIALEELGRTAANTAMLGAFARVTGWVSPGALLEVLPDYFRDEALAGNRRAVERGWNEARVFATAPDGELAKAPRAGFAGATLLSWGRLRRGPPRPPPIAFEGAWADPATLHVVPTGDWRLQRPVTRPARCSRCGLCALLCPAGSMHDRGTHFEADLAFCKGCGLCARLCPGRAIVMADEARA